MRIELNLDNYPALKELSEQDKLAFSAFLKGMMGLADDAIRNGYPKLSMDEFKIPYIKLMREVSEAFFDYVGILDNHSNVREAEALKILKLENNPLASKNFYRIIDGEQVTKEEFFGEEFRVKQWLQSMLYAGRYLSHADLVHYLTLDEFALVERMKTDRVQELIKIQPALEYQKNNDLIVGLRVKGTSFFDCGETKIDGLICEVCRSHKVMKFKNYKLCQTCQGATRKED